ncbi:MAG TPA: FAD-dependent oxidoreductase [Gemmatimonadaceae bacterium]|jgi:NADPH-dependent 2,4-dienoyl-CoA reductase/sulfur reductase-like enzyme/nitrite reductase/ring-hydroxylating ferredoxin subunit|nr:FAD-dependent oxidoreductase [Gemmatimonadaceae bacterium]
MDVPQEQLEGPDLVTDGIALAELADGTMVLGHANGEPVLIARRGDDLFAVGAKCTHYGAPLNEGLLVGDTVRCPWHHATFNLRTGEADRPPALNPLACWTVEHRDGRVYARAKRDRDPLAPTPADLAAVENAQQSMPPSSVVIVGSGAAGSAAAEMLRRDGYTGRITMIDGDDAAPYDRPNLSKEYLAGEAQEEWIPLRPAGFYQEHGIDQVRLSVTTVDVGNRQVHLADGSSHEYGALLLATGAEPRAIDIPGHDRANVHMLRSLADSNAIIALAEHSQCAVILGASFIGLEVAASLRVRGLKVHVVAPDATPLVKVLGPEIGTMIQQLHEEHGVVFHLEQTATRIDRDAVVLQNGERLPSDMVVVGIGVVPRLDLAKAAGLTLDRGVSVNEYLETSVPDIYAAGDIARWPDPHTGERIRVEHWVVAQRQGQTAARNILGARERFNAVPYFWSRHYDLSIRYTGHAEQWDRVDVSGDIAKRDCSVAYRKGKRTLAVASVMRDRENLEVEVALEENDEAALRHILAV